MVSKFCAFRVPTMTIFAASVFAFSIQESKASTIRCDECSATGMQLKAFQTASSTPAPYSDILYIVSQPSGISKKFQVSNVYLNGGNPEMCQQPMPSVPLECVTSSTSMELPVESAIATYVSYMQAYGATPENIWLNPSENFPHNGYEAVEYPQKSENVGTYIQSGGLGFLNDFLQLTSAVNPFSYFNPGAIKMTVRVNYEDGGSSLYVYNNVTKTFERVKGQTKDTSGNSVPESKEDVSGGIGSTMDYNFTGDPESLSEFIMRMEMLGVPITGPMSDRMVCTGGMVDGRMVVTCSFI